MVSWRSRRERERNNIIYMPSTLDWRLSCVFPHVFWNSPKVGLIDDGVISSFNHVMTVKFMGCVGMRTIPVSTGQRAVQFNNYMVSTRSAKPICAPFSPDVSREFPKCCLQKQVQGWSNRRSLRPQLQKCCDNKVNRVLCYADEHMTNQKVELSAARCFK